MEPESNDNNYQTPQRDIVGRYKSLLKDGQTSGGSVEDVGDGGEADLSEGGIKDRLDVTKSELHRIINQYLGGKPDLHEIADRIVANADEALHVLRDEDEVKLRERRDLLDGLETIVRTDGSRPSFMIRNGEPDRSTSPVGAWADTLDASADLLRGAIACVGRIDIPSASQGFEGTGFLIQENLILTNRHVLQAIAARNDDGTWTFKPGAAIDFGHEFRAQESINRRALRRVVFAGPKPILGNQPVDHTKLDLALIELEPAGPNEQPRTVLAVDMARDWAQPELSLYAVGYPANPGIGAFAPPLLELLFQSTYGYKRLAPGLIIKSQVNAPAWTVAHDTTTLGGNSGTGLLIVGRENAAAGLHYGGRRAEPRENWGHILGLVLDTTDGRSDVTLRQHLTDHGVKLIDRIAQPPVG
ncbi:MAG: trypsin-like peptidase domain-containing protein [Blastocatellia bacterium]